MGENEKFEIGYKLFKRDTARNFRLKDIGDLKRELPNISQETGIPVADLRQFAEIVFPEILQEQMKKLR